MPDSSNNIRLAVFGYRRYNIVYCQGLYYGWPWSAGEFAFEVYKSGTVPASAVGKSIMDVKNLIDEKLGPPNAEEEKQHDWTAMQQIEDANKASFMREEKLIKRIPKDERFLLIKQWGFGFWSDMEDVQSKLLLAEITNRHPIIVWGKDSLYSVGDNTNSFEQYFLPISDCSIGDVVSDKYTYYPPIWNYSNVFQTDPNKLSRVYRDVPSLINSDANVLVSDVHNFMHEIIPWVKEGHPAYGQTDDIDELYHTRLETGTVLNAHRYIINKYIKPQPDIVDEIDQFYHAHMGTGPILAVHIRAGVKLNEDSYWSSVNAQYPPEIDLFLKNNPSGRIFLLTDDDTVLEQYKQMYGKILIYTDCNRKTIKDDGELCLKTFPDRRRKGIEIIKDTYLACKCDYYIGYWLSNVTRAVRRLKVWENDRSKIFI